MNNKDLNAGRANALPMAFNKRNAVKKNEIIFLYYLHFKFLFPVKVNT
ncbi:hypothetical protein GCM10022378_08420 [Salinicoccus jeotgali]|uniref:Uncharacterized protein n=1 Tax=Salinicoccus jeotgali TaxID=381634 RepID=A0ABP7EMH0_9STAP